MALSPKDLARILKMRKAGIVNPVYTVLAANKAELPLTLACALLTQESGGGRNAWGHDQPPAIFAGGFDTHAKKQWGPLVTKPAYLAYKAQRGPKGAGGMQGVGPCQLTYFSHQDDADTLGGCWKPRWNMQIGFTMLHDLVQKDGLRAGIASYNGSGEAAQAYAKSVLTHERTWASALGLPSVQD